MGLPDKRYEAELLIALERAVVRMNSMASPLLGQKLYKDAEEWLRKVNKDRNEEGKEDPSKK